MSTSSAVINASSSRLAKAVKALREQRSENQAKDAAPSPERIIESQVDDVFLVLALLGEAILPLQVLDNAYYDTTLAEVHSAMASCGNTVIRDLWDKLDDELKYLCTAGLCICSVFAPIPTYRGFGACVFGDWDWGCPDVEYLERKRKKETSIFQKTPEVQPNRPILAAFDRAVQVLQVKTTAFLAKRPSISGFAEQQPRYVPRSKKEIKDDLDLCADWVKEIEKRGHPSPHGKTLRSWGMPFATWTSQYSVQFTRDSELVAYHQMDPGRLLHAFLCRGALTLHEGELLTLPAGTSAEAIVCWLSDLPSMTHKIIQWDAFDTAKFEKKASKKLVNKVGEFPLPSKYAIRDQSTVAPSTALVLASPPPYSPADDPSTTISLESAESPREDSKGASPNAGPRTQGEAGRTTSSERLPPAHHAVTASPPKRAPPPPPLSGTGVIRKQIRRKPTPNSNAMSFHPHSVSLPGRLLTVPPPLVQDMVRIRSDEPPPRPPKLPLEPSDTRSPEASRPQSDPTRNFTDVDRSGHYLQLLTAVAQGTMSPQQLQHILHSPVMDPVSTDIMEQCYITAEPQELDSDPAPPKFMGISIPRGELRKAYTSAAVSEPLPATLKPGVSR